VSGNVTRLTPNSSEMLNLADSTDTLSYSCYCYLRRTRPGNWHAFTFPRSCNA